MRLKKIILLFFLGVSFLGNAQDLKGFHIGVSVMPFHFWYQNKNFKNEDTKLKNDNTIINGFATGINSGYFFNNNWSINVGFEYANQINRFLRAYQSTTNSDGQTTDYFNSDNYEQTKLNYFKVPITVQYLFSSNRNIRFYISQGLQVSFLNNYEYKILQTNENGKQSVYIANPRTISQSGNLFPEQNMNKENQLDWYNKNVVGYVSNYGIKYSISDNLFLTSSLRFEYDFSNTDGKVFEYKNATTHNIRTGIELALSYKFEKKCGCSK